MPCWIWEGSLYSSHSKFTNQWTPRETWSMVWWKWRKYTSNLDRDDKEIDQYSQVGMMALSLTRMMTQGTCLGERVFLNSFHCFISLVWIPWSCLGWLF